MKQVVRVFRLVAAMECADADMGDPRRQGRAVVGRPSHLPRQAVEQGRAELLEGLCLSGHLYLRRKPAFRIRPAPVPMAGHDRAAQEFHKRQKWKSLSIERARP